MRSLAMTWFAATAAAQGVFVVDASNGPGTSYTSIQAAVQAVPDGSTLLVRAGVYTPVTIDAKGVAILCDANVTVSHTTVPYQPYLSITNTLPSQVVVVERLRPAVATLGARLNGANGPVILDGGGLVLQATGVAQTTNGPTLAVASCPQVTVRNATVLGGVQSGPSVVNGLTYEACVVTNSTMAFERCTVRGPDASPMRPGKAAIDATGSRILLTDCVVSGGNGMFFTPPNPTQGGAGIRCTNSDVHVRGDALAAIRGGYAPAPAPFVPIQHPAVAGSGNLWIDPAVQLTGAIDATITTNVIARPRVTSALGTIGATADARRDGPAGVFAALACSLPAVTTLVPPVPDPIWLEDASLFVAAFGIAPATGLTASIAIPNQPSLAGFALAWQAVDWDPSLVAAFSNPSLTFVR